METNNTEQIQTHLYLPKTSSLFKNLNKRGFMDSLGYFNLFLTEKPCIGELLLISSHSIKNTDFKSYLTNRNKDICLRITDLLQHRYNFVKSENSFTVISLKVYEDVDFTTQ